MAPISITLARRKPPAAVVALVGEHDAYSSERLENEFAMLLDAGQHIVVDLRDTSFLDSTSLGVLLNARHDAEEKGLRFVLVLAEGFTQVQQILSITGLGSGFASFSKVDDALNAVSPVRSVEAA